MGGGSWIILNLEQIGAEELQRRRAEFDRQKELARPNRGEERHEHRQGRAPFSGVRILDFTQVLAGPYASVSAGVAWRRCDQGGTRDGEDMRRTPLSRKWADRSMAPSWLAINGNKKSLTLDLRKPAAIGDRAEAGGESRRGDGELPRRRDGPARHWLQGVVGDQSEADLLCDFRLRPDRPVQPRGRL